MLIGSISNVTPPFSTRVSPSSEFSSKVNPYWKPEQPPPCTNTRSFRLGLDSSRISSPTLAAAAFVNTSVGARLGTADSGVMAAAWGQNGSGSSGAALTARTLLLGRRDRGLLAGPSGLARLVDQLAVDLRTHLHLDQRVVDVAGDARRSTELDTVVREDVALHRAVEHDVRYSDRAFDDTAVADTERRARVRRCIDVAFDVAVDMKAAGELHVADDAGPRTDERVDALKLGLTVFEHRIVLVQWRRARARPGSPPGPATDRILAQARGASSAPRH